MICTKASPAGWAISVRRRPSDIFVSHRVGMGASESTAYQRHWWNGETEGNWRSGYIMLSFLTGDEAGMHECRQYVQHILSSQAKDGYLGAFDEASRFQHRGELWTQACLLRGLLAYSELTGDKEVHQAVVRAADLIVTVYRSGDPSKPWAERPRPWPGSARPDDLRRDGAPVRHHGRCEISRFHGVAVRGLEQQGHQARRNQVRLAGHVSIRPMSIPACLRC